MPRGDRTGPRGAGPRSGRGLGYCAGYDAPGFTRSGFGYGGSGARWLCGGHGWRHQYYATGLYRWQRCAFPPLTRQEEVEALKREEEWLRERLNAVTSRLNEITSKEEVKDE